MLSMSASHRLGSSMLSQSRLAQSRLAAPGLGKSVLGRSALGRSNISTVGSLLQTCVEKMRLGLYAEAEQAACAINDYEQEIPLTEEEKQKAWVFRSMALLALGAPSFDAAIFATNNDIWDESVVYRWMRDLLGFKEQEQLKRWLVQRLKDTSSEHLAEFSFVLWQFHVYDLAVSILANLDASDPAVTYYLANSLFRLGLAGDLPKLTEALTVYSVIPLDLEDEDGSFATLGANIHMALYNYPAALEVVDRSLTATRRQVLSANSAASSSTNTNTPSSSATTNSTTLAMANNAFTPLLLSRHLNPDARANLQLLRAQICLKLGKKEVALNALNTVHPNSTHPDFLRIEMLRAKASTPSNARQKYRELLPCYPSPNSAERIIIIRADLKARLLLANLQRELEELLDACRLLKWQETPDVAFIAACACVKLSWYDAHPFEKNLPRPASHIPFVKPSSTTNAPASSSTTAEEPPSVRHRRSSSGSRRRAAIAAAASSSGGPVKPPDYAALSMEYFSTCLNYSKNPSRLASHYRSLVTLYIFSSRDSFTSELHNMAQSYLTKSLELDPTNPKASVLKAEILRLEGRAEEGIACLSGVAPTPSVVFENILCIGEKNRHEAINQLAAIRGSMEVSARFHRGRLFEELGQFSTADESYASALAVDPNHMETLYKRAPLLLSRLNNPSLALVYFDIILKEYPKDTTILELKAHALINLAKYQEAKETLDVILRISPNHPRAASLKHHSESLLSAPGYLSALAWDSAQSITYAYKSLKEFMGW